MKGRFFYVVIAILVGVLLVTSKGRADDEWKVVSSIRGDDVSIHIRPIEVPNGIDWSVDIEIELTTTKPALVDYISANVKELGLNHFAAELTFLRGDVSLYLRPKIVDFMGITIVIKHNGLAEKHSIQVSDTTVIMEISGFPLDVEMAALSIDPDEDGIPDFGIFKFPVVDGKAIFYIGKEDAVVPGIYTFQVVELDDGEISHYTTLAQLSLDNRPADGYWEIELLGVITEVKPEGKHLTTCGAIKSGR